MCSFLLSRQISKKKWQPILYKLSEWIFGGVALCARFYYLTFLSLTFHRKDFLTGFHLGYIPVSAFANLQEAFNLILNIV